MMKPWRIGSFLILAVLMIANLKAQALTPETIIEPAAVEQMTTSGQNSASPGGSYFAVTVFLIALVGGSFWLVYRKRWQQRLTGNSQKATVIAVEATRALGQRQYLMVARVGEERFLLGTGPQGPHLVSKLSTQVQQEGESVSDTHAFHLPITEKDSILER